MLRRQYRLLAHSYGVFQIRRYTLPPNLKTKIKSIQKEYDALNEAIIDQYTNEAAIKLARLQPIIDRFEQYSKAESELSELRDLVKDPQLGSEAREELKNTEGLILRLGDELKTSLVPPHPFADKACLLEIRPGIGGSEAALFAADLLRMYQNYCLRRKWACEVMSIGENPNGGISEAILNVREPGSYATFQHEGGVHRVQRVPATETKGRVHTSTAAVVVLPDLGDSIEHSDINPADIRVDVMRASGSGGQHVNTTESAVRIVHLPTNLIVTCQDERSQHKNKSKAMKVLQARLAELDRQEKQKQGREDRLSQVSSADRSDKSRTYNYPQNRITDHRSGITSLHLDEVLEGNEIRFNEIVDSVDQRLREIRMEELN